MAAPPVTDLPTWAALLIAARSLAEAPDAAATLVRLSRDPAARAAHVRALGQAGLARRMAASMAEADEAFAHPGPAKSDARLIFRQVAPAALADPAALAGHPLDPAATATRMAAAIRASGHGPDFARTVLAEPYFHAVTRPALDLLRDAGH